MAPARSLPRNGRNDPCWCGSGRKFKRCHMEEASTAAPARTEEALIAAFKSADDRDLRDPREVARVLARSGKPVLLIDEKRFGGPGKPFVFFSVVVLPAAVALAALPSIWRASSVNRWVEDLSGPRLLRDTRPEAVALRLELGTHLSQAVVVRAGITYDSLRRWRTDTGWPGIRTAQSGIEIKMSEFAVLQNLGVEVVRELNLRGLVLMVVDRAVQNGLDPSMHGLSVGELGAVTFDVPEHPGHLMILASTPEDATVGPWLRLPDFDAAVAAAAPEFAAFSHNVTSAPMNGTMVWWYPNVPVSEVTSGSAR